MGLNFKQYQRKVGAVSAAQVDELTQVAGSDGNLTAHPGQYVVQVGTKQVSRAVPDDKGVMVETKEDVPVYEVISQAEFEAEHTVDHGTPQVPPVDPPSHEE